MAPRPARYDLRDIWKGLPVAAVTAPERTAAQHQSLLHFVGSGARSDEKVLGKVREMVLPARNDVHCSLRIPDLRAGDDSPLRRAARPAAPLARVPADYRPRGSAAADPTSHSKFDRDDAIGGSNMGSSERCRNILVVRSSSTTTQIIVCDPGRDAHC